MLLFIIKLIVAATLWPGPGAAVTLPGGVYLVSLC